jgi:aspartate racemase
MTVLGIVGGTGPESTIEYYRLIVAGYRARRPDGGYPAIVIDSIDMTRLLDAIGRGDLDHAADYLTAEVDRLAAAGADIALLAANTPHVVFPQLQRRSPLPLISIVDATCSAATGAGLRRLGLLGPRFTMEARFYPDVFAAAGIDIVVPDPAPRARLHQVYMDELVQGIVRPAARDVVLTIIDELKRRDGIDGVILGGTELSLLVDDHTIFDLPVLNTTRIHADAAVDALLA